MAFHEQTQAVVEASVEQVKLAKNATGKLQAMSERRKGFGEELRRALRA